GSLGAAPGQKLVGGARRLVRPSPHNLHMLAYKKLTRRRGSACSAACRALCSEHDPDGLRARRWRAERQKAPERHQKNAPGRLGQRRGKTSLVALGWLDRAAHGRTCWLTRTLHGGATRRRGSA